MNTRSYHNIAVLSPSFSDGGAERVMSYLVNNNEHFSPYSLSDRLDYLVNKEKCVRLKNASLNTKIFRKIRAILFTYQVLRMHKVIITCSYELFIISGLLSLLMPNKTIVFRPSIGMDYIVSEIGNRFPVIAPMILFILRKLSYRAKIIYQSEEIKESFGNFPSRESMIISNPVAFESGSIRALVRDNNLPLRLVFSGRLTYEKGFDRFLESHAIYASNNDVEWYCYGAGPMEDFAAQRSAQSTNFKFMGWTPREKFETTNAVMVVPSRVEGVPNIVLEAIMAGWPIIASAEVCAAFKSDPIVSESLNAFEFENQYDVVNLARTALNQYRFEDHMETIQLLRDTRSVIAYSKIVHQFCTAGV